jgi:O-6-methylguanine DNA methyltransferase
MEVLFYSEISSPVGPLTLIASESALVRLEFGRSLPKMPRTTRLIESPESTAKYTAQLEEYFAGERKQFTLPLDLRGTDFQKQCWRALLTIPYGETRTYRDMAHAIGRPLAFRAVGMANHDNPIAIIVPCHRVIASDGTLGGYGGGLPVKRWLLDLERKRTVSEANAPFA